MADMLLEMAAQLAFDVLTLTPVWARECTVALIAVAALAASATLVMIFG